MSDYAREDFKPKKVTKEFILDMLKNSYETIDDTFKPLGLFYFTEDKGVIVACDNSTGDAWLESFNDEKLALSWLKSKAGEVQS